MAFVYNGAITGTVVATFDPITLTLTSPVAAGDTVVVVFGTDDANRTVTNVTDSGGHTYSVISLSGLTGGGSYIAHALATNGLSVSDEISINWSSSTDTMAQAFSMSGLSEPNVGSDTDVYAESTTYEQTVVASADGVMIAVFTFAFDYEFGGVSITDWTKLCEIDDAPDQSLQAYFKEVTAGANAASKTIGTTVGHTSAGVVLPYAEVPVVRRSQSVVMVGW